MLKVTGLGYFFRKQEGCRCDAFAQFLDEVGCKWCEVHFEDIIKELKNRSQEFNYPFSELGARVMLKIAIKLADR